MKFKKTGSGLLVFLFLSCPLSAAPDKSAPKTEEAPAVETPTAVPPGRALKNQLPGKILFLHKPMPSPAWGKVIQYHRDQILPLSEKNRETLHEFLFQDDAGVIRTATFHENSSGEGYWEVWIWDQP